MKNEKETEKSDIETKVLNFYRRFIFGKDYDKDNLTKENIYEWCFNNAWNDMARHVYTDLTKYETEEIKQTDLKQVFREEFKKYENNIFNIKATNVHYKLQSHINNYNNQIYTINDSNENKREKSVFSFGKTQKVVNMFFKYLYTFKNELHLRDDYFTKCDCPIDSKILTKLKIKNIYWSKLDDIEEYKSIQKRIDEEIKKKGLKYRLDFDFENW